MISLIVYILHLKVGDYMNAAEVILEIQKLYDERTREEILSNLNIAIALGKAKGLEVDRYIALPKITNRSKHSVMSWFNRPDKKIPLIDLCMIAKYLNYNIFAFFTTKENCNITKEDFLVANDYNNYNFPVDAADIFIRGFNLQYDTDKDIVLNNLEKFYGTSKQVLEHHSKDRQVRIMKVCGCTKESYRSWFNRSRKNVRIPLIPLCKMSIDANIEFFSLFV